MIVASNITLLPAIVFIYYRLSLPNQRWEFDFSQVQASFNLLLGRYLVLALFMVVVDLVAAAIGRHTHAADSVVMCCAAGALYSFMAIAWVIFNFETYLHHRYPKVGVPLESPYTTTRHAMTRALAVGAIVLSVLGVGLVVTGV